MFDPAVQVEGLCYSYGHNEVLHGITFSITPGTVVGLLGPNGAGKTTTLKLLTGIMKPDAGWIKVVGLDVNRDSVESKRRIGYAPEAAGLYESLSAQEFLELAGRLHRVAEDQLQTRIRAILDSFELAGKRTQRLGAYSKGMRQKVLLAAALLHDPDVLLLDEPLTGLDVTSSVLVKDLLSALASLGKTVIYSSHILDVVEKICNRVLIIHNGNLLADGTVEEIRAKTHEPSLEEAFQKVTQAESTAPGVARIIDSFKP